MFTSGSTPPYFVHSAKFLADSVICMSLAPALAAHVCGVVYVTDSSRQRRKSPFICWFWPSYGDNAMILCQYTPAASRRCCAVLAGFSIVASVLARSSVFPPLVGLPFRKAWVKLETV